MKETESELENRITKQNTKKEKKKKYNCVYVYTNNVWNVHNRKFTWNIFFMWPCLFCCITSFIFKLRTIAVSHNRHHHHHHQQQHNRPKMIITFLLYIRTDEMLKNEFLIWLPFFEPDKSQIYIFCWIL